MYIVDAYSEAVEAAEIDNLLVVILAVKKKHMSMGSFTRVYLRISITRQDRNISLRKLPLNPV